MRYVSLVIGRAGAISDDARPTVFISYARADRPRVAPLADALAASGHEVWWDALIDGGAAFAKTIEARLESADAVIVVWSAAAVGSDWVRDEAAHARDRKRLVPVSLDGTEAPLGFRQYHAIDLSGWRGDAGAPAIASLIRGVAAVRGTEVAARHVVAKPGISRRTMLLAGGGVAAAAAGGLVVWKPWQANAAGNSIAVMPFANLSGEPAQAYFSDGLSEEVRAALARNAKLKVAAPTSSNSFRERKADARTIGNQLGVAYLLEGSVRRSGEVVRVAADLIDTRTGFSSWSQSFDRGIGDIFAVQGEIAATVADALAARMTGVAAAPGGTANVAAYDALLRGRALFNSDHGEESDRAALAQYDVAIAADPNYATAHAARSRVLAAMAAQYGKADTLKAMFDASIASARMAVQIAPDLAAAQLALGYAIFTGRLDFRAARAAYDRALTLGRGDADILVLCAIYSARAGRSDEATQAIGRAASLDPLNPRTHRAAGSIHYAARRYPKAMAAAKRALELNPKISNAHAAIGNALLMTGRAEEARPEYLLEPNESFRLAGLGVVEHKLGNAAAARAALAALVAALGDGALYQQAQILAQWGDRDAALSALARARAAGDAGILSMRSDPMLDPIRSDPRFADLQKSLGLD